MFEQYPKASECYDDLLEALGPLNAEQHKAFAQLMFPKYMENDGVNFIFNDNFALKQRKSQKGHAVSHYYWVDGQVTKHENLFIGAGSDEHRKYHPISVMGLVGYIYNYINTLSSSDVEKLKKLVDNKGNIYPLLEIYLSEVEYFITDIAKHPDVPRWSTVTFFELLLFIRKNLSKILNLYWVHPDVLYSTSSRFISKLTLSNVYADLPILPFWYEIGIQTDNVNANTACDITREYYFNKLTQEQKDVFTSVLTELPETGWVRIDPSTVIMVLGACCETLSIEVVE